MAERVHWGLTPLPDSNVRNAGAAQRVAGIMAARRLEVVQAQYTATHPTSSAAVSHLGATVVSFDGARWTTSDGTFMRPISQVQP